MFEICGYRNGRFVVEYIYADDERTAKRILAESAPFLKDAKIVCQLVDDRQEQTPPERGAAILAGIGMFIFVTMPFWMGLIG